MAEQLSFTIDQCELQIILVWRLLGLEPPAGMRARDTISHLRKETQDDFLRAARSLNEFVELQISPAGKQSHTVDLMKGVANG